MIRTVAVVTAIFPLVTGGVLAATTTTNRWIVLESFILVTVPLLGLLLLGGLSICLLLTNLDPILLSDSNLDHILCAPSAPPL